MPVSSSTEHWIKPDALTINLNHFGDPDYLQVSVLAGAVVMAFKQDVIGYNAAHNYRTWPLESANTYLETSSEYHVYARLTRSEVNARALVIYDPVMRDIEGRAITFIENEDTGEEVEVLGDPNELYFFVYLGKISSSVGENGGEKKREWLAELQFGSLNTNQYQNTEIGGEWTKMFRLNKITDMIEVLKVFTSSVFKKISIKKGGIEKLVTDIKRSVDDEETTPVTDEVLPTAKYVDLNFLSSEKEDVAKEFITFLKGIMSGNFSSGELGSGFILKNTGGRSYMEIDELLVRKVAYFVQLVIKELKHVGGTIILSPASMKCVKVDKHTTYYRCYFQRSHEGKTIKQEFRVGDLARCQYFNVNEGVSENVKSGYYWRSVVGVSRDNAAEGTLGYIDLSVADCDPGSGEPQPGDEIVQLGNKTDSSRQNAIILSTVGDDAPSFKQYSNIHNFNMEDATLVTMFSPGANVITASYKDENGDDLSQRIEDIKVEWDKILAQTDKEFTMWFFEYSPDADRLPEVEWTTRELKLLHEEDLFYNTDKNSPEYGHAWRYVYNQESDTFSWEEITDEATIAALDKAFQAQHTADSAISELEKITSDDYLSRDEKKEVRREWDEITTCREQHLETASNFGLTEENCEELRSYLAAYIALGNYMCGVADGVFELGMIPLWISDDAEHGMGEHTVINGEEYRRYWTAYYDSEKKLQNFFANNAKDMADEAKSEADKIVVEMGKIASDEWLTVSEKGRVLEEWTKIADAYPKYKQNAETYGVDTEAYTESFFALGSYLDEDKEDTPESERWNGESVPSMLVNNENDMVDPAVYKSKWRDYYNQEIDLLANISKAIDRMGSGRVQIFTDVPVPPYYVGDRWNGAYWEVGGEWFYEDEYLVCWEAKKEGESFDINDWRPVSTSTISEIKTNSNGVEIISKAFALDENGQFVVKEESGLVTSSNFSSLFAKAVTSDGEAKEALLTVAVTKNADGSLDSSVLIKAANISINGIKKGSGDNSVVIGGFDINEKTISGGDDEAKMTLQLSDERSLYPSIKWGDENKDYAWLGMYKNSGYASGQIYLFNESNASLLVLADDISFNGSNFGFSIHVDNNWTYNRWTAPNSKGIGILDAFIGMSAYSEQTASYFVIRSNSWAREGQVPTGYVYKDDDGYLKVKG